jgi:hypothetical protein
LLLQGVNLKVAELHRYTAAGVELLQLTACIPMLVWSSNTQHSFGALLLLLL